MPDLCVFDVAGPRHFWRRRLSTAVIGQIGDRTAMSSGMQTAEAFLKPPHYGRTRIAIGKALYWHYRLFRRKRHDTVVLERIGDFPLVVLPGVLNPKAMRTGAFFASQLQAELVEPGAEVLDMGTGSGVCAIAAARYARRVVAVDINPVAVRCAGINAVLNHLEDRIDVRQGDLFAGVAAYLSVRVLMRFFETRNLMPFAVYCLAFGVISMIRFA